MGIVILAGQNHDELLNSVETFPRTSCNIPDTPFPIANHTLSVLTPEDGSSTTLVACSGSLEKECWSWQKGDDKWQLYASLDLNRYTARAISFGDRFLLIGAGGITIPPLWDTGVELPSGRTFDLENLAILRSFCLIPSGDTFILAGAHDGSTTLGPGLVERYSSSGEFIEYLPSLSNAYVDLGCGSFKEDQGNTALLMVGWTVYIPPYGDAPHQETTC